MSASPCSLTKVLLSLATPSLLGIIVAKEIYLEVSQSWGQASLELFRGERLPLLAHIFDANQS